MSQQQQPQEQQRAQGAQQLAHGMDPQLEDPISAVLYNEVIDPAISGSQDAGMNPPPVPSAKNLRGPAGPPFPHRNARRTSESTSIRSKAVTDTFSSQLEPPSQSTALQRPASGLVFGPPGSVTSGISSTNDTPSREAARARLMNAMLSRLFTATDDFFTQLSSEQVDQEIWDAEREGFKKAFDAYRTYYVRDDSDPVVNPAFVTEVMRLERASLPWYKVVRVVSAANLAMLFDSLTPRNHADPLSLPLLQALESDFPGSFIGEGSVNADNAMNQQIIEQTLMIRTQLTIHRLKELLKDGSAPFHPRLEVARIWCDGDVSPESIEAFLGNNNDGLQLKPIAPADSEVAALARDRNAIQTRFGSICKMLPDQEVNGDDLDLTFDRADLDVQPAFNMNSLRMLKQLEQQGGSVYGDSRKRQAPGQPSTVGDETAASAGQSAKRARRRKKNGVPEATMGPPSTAPQGTAPLAASGAVSQYPPLPGTQDEPDFDALSQRTREITAAARKVKEPQVRSGWVRRDIILLVKAVNTYQCKWSTIEKEIKAGTIPFERPRDQQALRDKARLLKQDFLNRTDTLLPRGFDLVVLGKKEKEAVKAVGKNPDRKEDDVDENGQPVNTEFREDMAAAPAALLEPLPPADVQPEQQQQQQQPEPEPQQEPQQAVPEQIAAVGRR
ncbi:hypothetical protein CHGG_06557 [Chaetomium globosum CBS 148.51]|uniref:Myb-like domain-containing protein n=1 Tax=Chaetomium globosum (strain ATCC 6205 / CBS 148.51 / DSM 1962 / NBRC 6347 / NRRL 1970) TaxID=306901 RepID=Q2H458_CHAGB|nr:uncharacterized protein CHGG_06557 [Chaetomium globosum CBS 148.51]EAQ89938.1 hypothetical protein CHGG_06557 [Chaetomium globosum CBS 148.51]